MKVEGTKETNKMSDDLKELLKKNKYDSGFLIALADQHMAAVTGNLSLRESINVILIFLEEELKWLKENDRLLYTYLHGKAMLTLLGVESPEETKQIIDDMKCVDNIKLDS